MKRKININWFAVFVVFFIIAIIFLAVAQRNEEDREIRDEGYAEGYESGYNDAIRENFPNAETSDYQYGYGDGYSEGYEAAREKYEFMGVKDAVDYYADNQQLNDLINAIFDRLGADEMYELFEEYQ